MDLKIFRSFVCERFPSVIANLHVFCGFGVGAKQVCLESGRTWYVDSVKVDSVSFFSLSYN